MFAVFNLAFCGSSRTREMPQRIFVKQRPPIRGKCILQFFSTFPCELTSRDAQLEFQVRINSRRERHQCKRPFRKVIKVHLSQNPLAPSRSFWLLED